MANKKPYFEFKETLNILNKLFIKEWSGGITNNIDDIPKNRWVLVKVKWFLLLKNRKRWIKNDIWERIWKVF